MKSVFSYLFSLLLCLILLTTLLGLTFASEETCDEWVAKAVSVQGSVEVRKVGEAQWQPVILNDTYCPGDVIRVGENSRAGFAMSNSSLLRLNQNTVITLGELKEKRTSLLDLLKGAAYFFSRVPRGVEVRTPYAIAGVRGTEFYISVQEEQTFLTILKGDVRVSSKPAVAVLLAICRKLK